MDDQAPPSGDTRYLAGKVKTTRINKKTGKEEVVTDRPLYARPITRLQFIGPPKPSD